MRSSNPRTPVPVDEDKAKSDKVDRSRTAGTRSGMAAAISRILAGQRAERNRADQETDEDDQGVEWALRMMS